MMETAEDGERHDLSSPGGSRRRTDGHQLIDALVRARLVEVAAVFDEHREQVLLAENEEVVEALPSHAAEKPFDDCVGARGPDGRLEDPRTSAASDAIELRAVLGVAVADHEARRSAEDGGVAHLLRDPAGAGLARDRDVDDPARAQLDDEKCEDGPETSVAQLQKNHRSQIWASPRTRFIAYGNGALAGTKRREALRSSQSKRNGIHIRRAKGRPRNLGLRFVTELVELLARAIAKCVG